MSTPDDSQKPESPTSQPQGDGASASASNSESQSVAPPLPPVPTSTPMPTEDPKTFIHRVRVFWDTFFESFGASKMGDHLWEEIPSALKNSTILTIVLLGLVAFFWRDGCQKSDQITTLDDDKKFLQGLSSSNAVVVANYQVQMQALYDRLNDKESRITSVTQERDKAQLLEQEAKHALAQWVLLAQSHTTNTPLTETMKLLSHSLSDNTKTFEEMIKAFDSNRPKFELSINNNRVSDETFSLQMLQKGSRDIFLKIENVGKTTAQQLNIDFYARIDETNFVKDARWVKSGKVIEPSEGMCAFSIISQRPVPPGQGFSATTFSLSTNSNQMGFMSQIDVYAEGTVLRRYGVLFVLTP